jgi:hypothetical protein
MIAAPSPCTLSLHPLPAPSRCCAQHKDPKLMHCELVPFLEKNTSLFMKVGHMLG